MAVPVAALAKLAAAALSDEDTRRKLGWIVAAICSPLILTLALICSLLSGSAEHNNSAVLLCFHGGDIPGKTPAEYVAYIEDMRRSFTLLDDAVAAVNDMTENSNSLDGIRVKAVFYAIFFGEDTPSRRAHRQFVDCFVTYEERTRTVTDEDGTETEESYTVAIPVTDMVEVYSNIENVLHLQISEEQKSNADSIYNLVRYGIADGSEGWMSGADGCAGGDCQVHAAVSLALPGDGIDAVSEFRGDAAFPSRTNGRTETVRADKRHIRAWNPAL